MKDVEERNLKDFGIGQKGIFDYFGQAESATQEKDGMPNWFWKLANECKSEIYG